MRLRASAGGAALSPSKGRIPNPGPDAVFFALGHTIRSCSLPVSLFEDLLSAFRQDVVTKRCASWAEVMDYCRRSANPVGRLVLRVAGLADERLDRASDAVCTALQLTNFWQDLERDWQKGRLYVPRDERERFGARESDLDARSMSPAWRAVLSEMAARTRRLFAEGRPVCDGVSGRLGYELRLTWLGGMRILDRLERGGFDVFTARPALRPSDVPALLWGAAAWGRPKAA
jgi:phytoene synthase